MVPAGRGHVVPEETTKPTLRKSTQTKSAKDNRRGRRVSSQR